MPHGPQMILASHWPALRELMRKGHTEMTEISVGPVVEALNMMCYIPLPESHVKFHQEAGYIRILIE